MNPLYATTNLGTLAELLVQLRLLEHDIQAAPPIKDSGNDLIAIRGRQFRALQVRRTTRGIIDKPHEQVLYDILAVVHLPLRGGRRSTNDAKIYLFAQDEVPTLGGNVSRYQNHLLSRPLIDRFFGDDIA